METSEKSAMNQHTRRFGLRLFAARRLIASLGALVLISSEISAAPKMAELIDGVAGVSAYQREGLFIDKVVFTFNQQDAFSARLRLQDRGADFADEKLGDETVDGTCTTFNGFTLELDCRIYRTSDRSQVAHLRVPLH